MGATPLMEFSLFFYNKESVKFPMHYGLFSKQILVFEANKGNSTFGRSNLPLLPVVFSLITKS